MTVITLGDTMALGLFEKQMMDDDESAILSDMDESKRRDSMGKKQLTREQVAERALIGDAQKAVADDTKVIRQGAGGWGYILNDDGSVEIAVDPRKTPSAQGKKLTEGKAYEAIKRELSGEELDKPMGQNKPKTGATSNARAAGAPPPSDSTKSVEKLGQAGSVKELAESDASEAPVESGDLASESPSDELDEGVSVAGNPAVQAAVDTYAKELARIRTKVQQQQLLPDGADKAAAFALEQLHEALAKANPEGARKEGLAKGMV